MARNSIKWRSATDTVNGNMIPNSHGDYNLNEPHEKRKYLFWTNSFYRLPWNNMECESDDDVSLPNRLGRVRNNHKLACKVWEVQNSNWLIRK